MTLAMITASVNAELGETPKQMESANPVHVEHTDDGMTVFAWIVRYPKLDNKPLMHKGMFANGEAVAEQFMFIDRHAMS
jgi:hypothetical protein